MRPELIGQVGIVLATLGAGLQWFRALKSFPEWAYYLVAALFTAGGVILGMDPAAAHDWRAFVLNNWPLFVTLYGTVLGGTKAVSSAAQGAEAAGGNPASALIPITNSK